MKIIDDQTREELSKRFRNEMRRKVKLILFVSDDISKCPLCPTTRQFLRELAGLTEKIEVETHDINSDKAKEFGVKRIPTLLVDPDEGYLISYTGSPLGYEAASLIETIIQVSNDTSKLSQSSKKKLKDLKKKIHIETYVTPTCPYCPRQVLLANMIAIEARGTIKSEVIEVIENPDLAKEYQIQAVPFNVVNGKPVSIGVQQEDEFVNTVIS
mgnify:CR=1 FL=1